MFSVNVLMNYCYIILFKVWVCQLTLDPGSYMLLPYTTGCVLMNEEEREEEEWLSLLEEKDDKLKLTQECMYVQFLEYNAFKHGYTILVCNRVLSVYVHVMCVNIMGFL